MNNLAKNIRFLRKKNRWSQEELAKRIGIKRSSIAAYESKNVEPRLKTILELGKIFNVDIVDLIDSNIAEQGDNIRSFNDGNAEIIDNQPIKIDFKNKSAVQEFIDTTISTRKMLDGLKVFYKFKMDRNSNNNDQMKAHTADINSFIMLVEHLLSNNEDLVNFITKNKQTIA
ncbi:MAG: helix-turn-helix transcriptional regulator [Bacteroidota bacterium]